MNPTKNHNRRGSVSVEYVLLASLLGVSLTISFGFPELLGEMLVSAGEDTNIARNDADGTANADVYVYEPGVFTPEGAPPSSGPDGDGGDDIADPEDVDDGVADADDPWNSGDPDEDPASDPETDPATGGGGFDPFDLPAGPDEAPPEDDADADDDDDDGDGDDWGDGEDDDGTAVVDVDDNDDGKGKSNNGHGNNQDGVDSSNPGQGNGGPNGGDDPSGNCDDEAGVDCGSEVTIDVPDPIVPIDPGVPGEPERRTGVGYTATILLTLSDPNIPEWVASTLVSNTIAWVTPVADPNILVVRDDFHHNEDPWDTPYVADLISDAGYTVTFMDEPKKGLKSKDIRGYDIVWMANPGWPMDDMGSFATLSDAMAEGTSVVLQGDDMTFSHKNRWDPSVLTGLDHDNNGTKTCGKTTDNNRGENYTVTFGESGHAILAGLEGVSFEYGNDIDHSAATGDRADVQASGTVSGCGGFSTPVVTTQGGFGG